jgi:excisionase family DNA binding protein
VSDILRTLAQFGEQIQKPKRVAERIVKGGELPGYRIGGQIRVKQSDIDKWIESRRIQSAAEPTSLKSLVARAVQRERERRAS